MGNAATATRVGVTGAVSYAPTGTTAPTTAIGTLASAFNDVGFVTDAGITLAYNTSTADIRAWQGNALVRRTLTQFDCTAKFSMLETNERSLLLYYGNYTHGAAAASGVAGANGSSPFRGVFVIDVVDGTSLVRYVFPDAQVTDWGDISITNADAISYEITITGYADSAGNGHYTYVESIAAS